MKFKVKNIEISGITNKFNLVGLQELNGKNILLLSGETIKRDLLMNNPIIKQINVQKKYPDKLILIIETYRPAVYFVVDQGYFILSADGRILSKIKKDYPQNELLPGGIPKINYYQKLNYSSWKNGDYLRYKDIVSALHFLKTALDLGLEINTIDINGTNMIALQMKGKKIIFTTEKDESVEDYQLNTIIRQFKIEGRDFDVLDLRFDKPMVQFKNN
ncbi:MAG: FtsQ-type POTRA domain-containing protein [Candidatus Roizmanbacteria bacterium]|nr:MAG: FtsQ-type POTRA domain-containing protein [Candidatus Roizmanbacteria bacterium]